MQWPAMFAADAVGATLDYSAFTQRTMLSEHSNEGKRFVKSNEYMFRASSKEGARTIFSLWYDSAKVRNADLSERADTLTMTRLNLHHDTAEMKRLRDPAWVLKSKFTQSL